MEQRDGMEASGGGVLAGGWPDGFAVKWKACPSCGCTKSFYDVVTAGEGTLQPQGTTKLFMLPMPYRTLLQSKSLTAFIDICPECGTVFCRAVLKAVDNQALPAHQKN